MSYLSKKNQLLSILQNPKFLLTLWVIICGVASLKQYLISDIAQGNCHYNNFRIFYYSFEHLLQGKNLYDAYPSQYFDLYLYGPIFALLVAPFYYLPESIGIILWGAISAWILFKAIWSLPLNSSSKATIIWISTNNLITSALNLQFNAICAAMIIFSFTYVLRKKDLYSAFFIILGTLIKIYGIIGVCFFVFSKNKTKAIVWSLCFTVVLLLLPAIICGPTFAVQCYKDWYDVLALKNAGNINITGNQLDVCVMGMVRKITQNPHLSNLYYIVAAMLLMAASFLNFKLHKNLNFQIALLGSLLMFIILASTGSESPTYIIAFPGVGIWYVLERKKNFLSISLLVLTLLISSFSPTDLFPRFVRVNYLQPYALMALPVFLVWLRLNYLMITNQLKPIEHTVE